MLNLDPRLYVDPAVLPQERNHIFARTWQLLGPVSQLSGRGDYVSADIAGLKVFVIRARDGALRGFRNVCRHRGAQLLPERTGRCSTIRCPYHQWVFGDEGQLINAPWFGDDPDFSKADWPLETIQVAEWRGLLFVAIAPEEDLVSQLGDLVGELADEPIETYQPVGSERVNFDANWKIYTDNFVEGYHIPGTHPSFFAAIEFEEFKTTAHQGFVRMTAPPRDGLFYRGKWLWMWPNWTLSLFNGGMNTSRINPLGTDRTEQIYHFYFADTSPATETRRQATIAGNLAVVREDYEVCVRTHQNYASGAYGAGPLSPRHEQGVHYFQQRVRESLEG
ncbi:MAG: aromatic ring-hydroxylating dioxygenase subunit alpha [Alphaproteobacteria bacterium]|nr:aromatic ring-hydroxylating dioxygenase subunit alpha [Alphaproteobacteria bacterium]